MSQLKLAKELGLARSTVQYYLSKGNPDNLEGARQWLADYKASKSMDVSIPVTNTPASGGSFEDRLT